MVLVLVLVFVFVSVLIHFSLLTTNFSLFQCKDSVFVDNFCPIFRKNSQINCNFVVSDTNRSRQMIDFQQLIAQTTLVEWILLALLLVVFCAQLFIYAYYYMGVVRHNRPKTAESRHQPPVSVVICARDETENLEQFLPLILE